MSARTMSAAAARRRKKQQKLAAPRQQSGGDDKSDDPVALLTDPRIRLNMKKQVEQLKTKPQWKSMPKETQAFLLETPPNSLNLHSFHRFWTSGKVVKFINQQFINPVSKIAPGDVMRDNCYSLALEYLNLKEVSAARALMLNGAFLHDSTVSSMAVCFMVMLKYIYVSSPAELCIVPSIVPSHTSRCFNTLIHMPIIHRV